MTNPVGRPTDFYPELGERILELMEGGLSLAAAAAECNVHRQRVYDWVDKHEQFADTVRLAQAKRQLFLEKRLLSAEIGPVVTSTIFALKNAGHQDWRDTQQIEHSGPDGGPIRTESAVDISLALKGLPDEDLEALERIAGKLAGPKES